MSKQAWSPLFNSPLLQSGTFFFLFRTCVKRLPREVLFYMPLHRGVGTIAVNNLHCNNKNNLLEISYIYFQIILNRLSHLTQCTRAPIMSKLLFLRTNYTYLCAVIFLIYLIVTSKYVCICCAFYLVQQSESEVKGGHNTNIAP